MCDLVSQKHNDFESSLSFEAFIVGNPDLKME